MYSGWVKKPQQGEQRMNIYDQLQEILEDHPLHGLNRLKRHSTSVEPQN